MRLLSRFLIIIAAVLCPVTGFAETLMISPIPALSIEQVNNVGSYKKSAGGIIEGTGATLLVGYHSNVPLNTYIGILNNDGTYSQNDLYYFVLPKGSDMQANVDLTALTTWSPSLHRYTITFLSNDEQSDTAFTAMNFQSAGMWTTFRTAMRHLFFPEPFRVSAAHFLQGYRILGVPFSVIFGLFVFVAACCALILRGKRAVLTLLALCMLAYGARFAIDLSVMTAKDLRSWVSLYRYGVASDTYIAAESLIDDVHKRKIAHPHAISCFDSTDYFPKLIRYLAYPIPVELTGALLPGTTHVIVIRKFQWSYENGILQCGSIHQPAQKISSFDDDIAVFSLSQP